MDDELKLVKMKIIEYKVDSIVCNRSEPRDIVLDT